MKRQHVLVLLAVVAALAAAVYQMNSSSRSHAGSNAEEVAVSPPSDEPVMKDQADLTATSEDLAADAESDKTAVPSAPQASREASEQVAEEIQENLANARKIMQQKAAIAKAKPEEVHHVPKQTLDAAKRLGEIAELEAQHPEQAESFREFYLECARDENTITVTRAQCLDKYMKASSMDAAAQKQFLQDFPEEIVRLVEALQ
jgi:hypothetical protein